MAKRIADKNIIEGLELAATAAESFLKVYYKAKKELEGFYSPTSQKGRRKELIDQALNKQQLNVMRSMNRLRQNS